MTEVNELDLLKAQADTMGIKYHPAIGLEKLRTKVNEILSPEEDVPEVPNVIEGETEAQYAARLHKEANKLVRVRISCMNPTKVEWPGEIFSVGNKYIGFIKKFIPYQDAEDGYHVPAAILDILKNKQYRKTETKKINGKKIKVSKMYKEFNIEMLDPLSVNELQQLATRQAMANTGD